PCFDGTCVPWASKLLPETIKSEVLVTRCRSVRARWCRAGRMVFPSQWCRNGDSSIRPILRAKQPVRTAVTAIDFSFFSKQSLRIRKVRFRPIELILVEYLSRHHFAALTLVSIVLNYQEVAGHR